MIMKKEKAKGFLMGVICTVLVMSSVLGAAAATGAVNLSATYRNIKITLNGSELTPKDANGKTVEPFIVDGTTYLPVRAVSEALGLDVDWNNSTNTVELSGTPVADNGVITVRNNAELKAALKRSNVEIHLEAGTYSSYDEFSMSDVSNVKLMGGEGVKLVNTSGIDRILSIYNCSGIKISGITMGHELQSGEYYCSAGVVGTSGSYNVTFDNCDLYGCGNEGFETWESQNVTFNKCNIHDCSDCIAYTYESTVNVKDCLFEGNGYGEYRNDAAFYAIGGSTLAFTNCEFKNNYNGEFCYTGDAEDSSYFTESGCKYSGNAWEATPVG